MVSFDFAMKNVANMSHVTVVRVTAMMTTSAGAQSYCVSSEVVTQGIRRYLDARGTLLQVRIIPSLLDFNSLDDTSY